MNIDFAKYTDGLAPAVIQDATTGKVLMLGFMNQDAFNATNAGKKVVFYSRSKQRLWTKGETSGNYLNVEEILCDCDNDSLLIKVNPQGPVCHTGADTCFNERNSTIDFLAQLQQIIRQRKQEDQEQSYTSSLFRKGINKIAQKVGEEAVELVIESKDNNDALFLGEAADLLFHYLVLLSAKEKSLEDVVAVLQERHAG
jgi:phosphoribosyl-ATP pyrophosphohydrolase/phosphoribosyl-AMP cyclohydrolase